MRAPPKLEIQEMTPKQADLVPSLQFTFTTARKAPKRFDERTIL
jgi:hypothetical protein